MKFLSILYIKSISFMSSYRLLIILTISLILLASSKYLYLDSEFAKSEAAKIQVTLERLILKNTFSTNKIITTLESLTQIKNPQLWIHNIELKDGKIKMIVRGLDSQAISYYLYSIEQANKLVIDSLVLRNKNYNVTEQLENNNSEPIPFALKMFLDRRRKNAEMQKNNIKEVNAYDNILYYYEAEVVFASPKNL
jgi:hypothetical protein